MLILLTVHMLLLSLSTSFSVMTMEVSSMVFQSLERDGNLQRFPLAIVFICAVNLLFCTDIVK